MTSTLLTTKEGAEYLKTTPRGFDQWARRHGVPYLKYGAHRRYEKTTLDKVLATMARRDR